MFIPSLLALGPRRAIKMYYKKGTQSKRWCKLCCIVYPEGTEELHLNGARHLANMEKMDYLTDMARKLWEKKRNVSQRVSERDISYIQNTIDKLTVKRTPVMSPGDER